MAVVITTCKRRGASFTRCRLVRGRHERNGDASLQLGVFACLGANFEISGSEKYILVDPGDGFAMDNGASKKKILRSDREDWTPLPWICYWICIHTSSILTCYVFIGTWCIKDTYASQTYFYDRVALFCMIITKQTSVEVQKFVHWDFDSLAM